MKITWAKIKKAPKIIARKFTTKITAKISNRIDERIDLEVCGISLVKYVPSIFRDDKQGVGMTGSQSTRYGNLEKIFSHVDLKETDSFLDVGCGKGRVLAYLIRENCPASLHGIEINELSAKVALEWTSKYDQIHVQQGDAFKIDYDSYTVLFLGRPFLPKTFLEFLDVLESQLTHPITFIYWVDQQSGYLLKNRKGWTMKYREVVRKVYGFKIPAGPQGFSIWEYTPDNSISNA